MAEQMDSGTASDTAQHEYECILRCGKRCAVHDSLDNITQQKWNSIHEKAIKWKDLDTFVNVHCSVDWEKGPKGHHMHMSCYTTLSSNDRLTKAKRRQIKVTQNIVEDTELSYPSNHPTLEASEPKKLRSNTGRLHDKMCCVWCMKVGNRKPKNVRDGQLLLLSTLDAWTKFRLHTVRLEDEAMRERLGTLIDSIPDGERAFGIEIRYHRACWRRYISDYKPLTEELPASQEIINDLERFVIRYVYCDPKSVSLGDVRAVKWRAQKKKSTIRIAPDRDSLRPHLQRANYLAYLQRNFKLQSHPSPIGHGWKLEDGLCLPVRYTQPPLPSTISLPECPIQQSEEDSDVDGSCGESDDSSSCSSSSSRED